VVRLTDEGKVLYKSEKAGRRDDGESEAQGALTEEDPPGSREARRSTFGPGAPRAVGINLSIVAIIDFLASLAA